MDHRQKLGRYGEEIAAQHLMQRGFHVLCRNFRHRETGEIDIIAQSAEGLVAFIEVKTRSNTRFGRPMEAVNEKKQHRLRQTALHFLAENPAYESCSMRFDVIEVIGQDVRHITNAF
jgi:putative endonuclease